MNKETTTPPATPELSDATVLDETTPEVPPMPTTPDDETSTPTEGGDKVSGTEKTEAFKERLAARYSRVLGKRISKAMAWTLFKTGIHAGFGAALALPQGQQKLSLSGVGTFEIGEYTAKNPASVALGFHPRARFFPSSAIQNRVEAHYGMITNEDGTKPDPLSFVPDEDKDVQEADIQEEKAAPANSKPDAKTAAKVASKAVPAKEAVAKASKSKETEQDTEIDLGGLDLDDLGEGTADTSDTDTSDTEIEIDTDDL